MSSLASPLGRFLQNTNSLVVLTGAGVSTASGIPDYRDSHGNWKHAQPIQYGDFVRSQSARRRYWARSYVGWQRFGKAQPNAAHYALARLESAGKIDTLVTQNVDRLHAAAGSRRVIDLHGDLATVRCLGCDATQLRADYQQALVKANPDWRATIGRYKPDGDAELAGASDQDFVVQACERCGGIVKPDVVLFGEAVPRQRVMAASAALARADALLVVGSSLMLFSGFRFVRQAKAENKPVVIVNLGRTRADALAELKVEADCAQALLVALDEILPAAMPLGAG